MSQFFLILFTLFSVNAQARLMVNISMVYKNGIDKNLVLESELHSVEEVWGERQIALSMKNRTRLLLKVGFWERPLAKSDNIGPSSIIYLEGVLYHPSGEVAERVTKETAQVELGKTYTINYKDKKQLIEVTVRPYLQ